MAEDENVLEEVEEVGCEIGEYEYEIEPVFECRDCKLEFDTPEQFAKHIDKNHSRDSSKELKLEDLICPECKYVFTRKNNLWRHVRKFHKHLRTPLRQVIYEAAELCPACNRKFTRKSNLLRHIRRFHKSLVATMLRQNPKIFNCPECNTGFTKWNNMKRHAKQFHASISVDQLRKPSNQDQSLESTQLCEIMFDEDETIDPDDSIDQEEEEVDGLNSKSDGLIIMSCTKCTLVFTSKNEFDQHNEHSHVESDLPKTYEKKTCPLCSFYDSKLNMYLHFTSAHDSPIMIECLDFESVDEFTKWREYIESESRVQFVELTKKVQSDSAHRTLFMCSLSKESAEKCAVGGFCPAEITLSKTPEKVSILFVKTHIGHGQAKVATITDQLYNRNQKNECPSKMEILKAEIERKRKLLEEKNVINDKKRYFKTSELYQRVPDNSDSKDATVEEKHTSETITSNDDGNDETRTLPRKEVIRRLRDRGEPILLFGESELQAFQRLRKNEILEPELNKGLRNDFQEAMEKVDQDYLDTILFSTTKNDDTKIDEKNIIEDPMEVYEKIQTDAVNLGNGDLASDMEIIMKFLQLLLQMWSNQLNSLSGGEKIGTKGKLAFATYTQTQIYLKPLFRKLKSKKLPEDILDSLTIIVKHLLERNYIMASDAYLQMAIGNAPWPIGVTMVGIHARTGREKIFSKNVAHVLNDETQRKYIQALKRLMTKCQQFFPTDPSRCVEYTET